MYVDDIIVIGDDYSELEQLKWYLAREFELKVLGSLKYFFFWDGRGQKLLWYCSLTKEIYSGSSP